LPSFRRVNRERTARWHNESKNIKPTLIASRMLVFCRLIEILKNFGPEIPEKTMIKGINP